MERIGMLEIFVIAVVIMILFGAKKLPEFARSIAEAIKEFKKASKDQDSDKKVN